MDTVMKENMLIIWEMAKDIIITVLINGLKVRGKQEYFSLGHKSVSNLSNLIEEKEVTLIKKKKDRKSVWLTKYSICMIECFSHILESPADKYKRQI